MLIVTHVVVFTTWN